MGAVVGKYPSDGEAMEDLLRCVRRRAPTLHEVLAAIAHAAQHDDLALVLLHARTRNYRQLLLTCWV